jgi:hypothetical protein
MLPKGILPLFDLFGFLWENFEVNEDVDEGIVRIELFRDLGHIRAYELLNIGNKLVVLVVCLETWRSE